MSKLDDASAKMVANLEEKYGKSLDEWMGLIKGSGHSKHGEIVKWLKTEYGMTHGYANTLSIISRRPADGEEEDLVANQYSGAKSELKPIYEAVMTAVDTFGSDVEVAPKKAYVSLRRNKQFAIVQPSTKTRVDVGINLKEQEPTERLEKSGSFNSMVSHRVRLTDITQVDEELIGWLRQAYESA